MNNDSFARDIGTARRRLQALRRQAQTSSEQQTLLHATLEELSSAVEELRVASEELRVQNLELAKSRQLLLAEHQHYRGLFDFAPDAYIVTDSGGTIREANRAAEVLLGISAGFLIQKPLILFFPEQEHKRFRELLTRLPREEAAVSWETQMQPRDRAPVPVSLTAAITGEIPLKGRPAVGIHWLARDITQRLQSEQLIRESQERFRALIDNVKDYAIFTLDPEGFVASWNLGAERIKGYQSHEILGKHFSRFYPRADVVAGKPQQNLTIAATEGRLEDEGWRVRKDGSLFWANVTITALRDDSGKLRGFSKVTRDITERKKVDEQLRESETRLKAIMDNSPAMIFVKDRQGRYLYANPVFNNLSRAAGTQVLGKTDFDLFPREQAAAFRTNDLKVFEAGVPVEFEETALQADGLHTSVVCKFPLFDTAGHVYGVCGIVTDVTELKRAATELQRAHYELEMRVEQRTADLSSANKALEEEINRRERTESQLRASEGKLRRSSQELEEQLIESDRLIAIGELAASIAHEFNNPLQIILGYTQEVLSEINLSQPHHESLKVIEGETRRCAELIRNLMEFARPAQSNLRPSDIELIISAAVKITRSYLEKSRIRIAVEIQPDLPPIAAESNQLQQVLLNLFFNAVEAMPQGGDLTIRATSRPLREGSGRQNEELTVAVSDTGTGIEPAALPKIFRSFFTTKQKKGMGLGLSICERIVKAHRGRISVESAPGKGTTFYLHFPLTDKGDDGSDS